MIKKDFLLNRNVIEGYGMASESSAMEVKEVLGNIDINVKE